MSKRYFYEIFWPSWQRALTEKNIKSGWRKAGINPFDPSVVLNQLVIDKPCPSSNNSTTSKISTGD